MNKAELRDMLTERLGHEFHRNTLSHWQKIGFLDKGTKVGREMLFTLGDVELLLACISMRRQYGLKNEWVVFAKDIALGLHINHGNNFLGSMATEWLRHYELVVTNRLRKGG